MVASCFHQEKEKKKLFIIALTVAQQLNIIYLHSEM